MLKQFEVCDICEDLFTTVTKRVVVNKDLAVTTRDAVKDADTDWVVAKKGVYHKDCLKTAMLEAYAEVKGVAL